MDTVLLCPLSQEGKTLWESQSELISCNPVPLEELLVTDQSSQLYFMEPEELLY
jgi:hypothetical protein